MAIQSQSYGLVTGRISSLALDPSDPTGNRLYVGTTGGGVWVSQNAGTSNVSSITFTPLTDFVSALDNAIDPSITIGALTVQPGRTGVVLAGAGDPNNALDSYHGAGILRSTDGGNTWALIQQTSDLDGGQAAMNYSFVGEAFSGFAWSTLNPQLIVAAVTQSREASLVGATWTNSSYTGLYYSSDSGATWHLARLSDGNGTDVQGTLDVFTRPDGNPATSVVWNPVRNLFIAAIRLHGYYQSSDGITWTRLDAQPGPNLTAQACPTNPGRTGSTTCPIERGALAVNPLTGDTFAWTVDANNQDQGIWQDVCGLSHGACANTTISFGKQWSASSLQSKTLLGPATIANGDYNLVLAAVPSDSDTLLFAGANDVWKCSLAANCAWRNTTNSATCMSAQVAPYQHAIEWNAANPLELFLGNDSGLWRTTDAIGETGAACNPTDASHFQNLNGTLGSLAEVGSLSNVGASPGSLVIGLGVNGTAGIKSATSPTSDWPLILGGIGGSVAIDPTNANTWYVNNDAGVSIHACSQAGPCTPADFGALPAIGSTDVSGDGVAMTAPAPFLVDPADTSQLLVATCRVWRGPASGKWTSTNAVSPMLDGGASASCNGNTLIRSIAALALPAGGEVVYAGLDGIPDGGATRAGHVFSASMSVNGEWSKWTDLTANSVTNDVLGFNSYGFGISSLFIDPHDVTGKTVYATIAGFSGQNQSISLLYRSTDGGAHWSAIAPVPAFNFVDALVIDPTDANTAYIGTDKGVYVTQQLNRCADAGFNCWGPYGTGLPLSPVVALSASPANASPGGLVAATYGRGVWTIPLISAAVDSTTASPPTDTLAPGALTFPDTITGQTSAPLAVTLTNSGGNPLTSISASVSGSFLISANTCTTELAADSSCTVLVSFLPTGVGSQTGKLTIADILKTQTVSLSGTGLLVPILSVSPATLNFNGQQVNVASPPATLTVSNTGGAALANVGFQIGGPSASSFSVAVNTCGASLAAGGNCTMQVVFTPAASGTSVATLTLSSSTLGVKPVTLQLNGNGQSSSGLIASPAQLAFAPTLIGQTSASQTVTIGNPGTHDATGIALAVSGPFSLAQNQCSSSLAAGASCTTAVAFSPMQSGALLGSLTASSASLVTPVTVVLSGTGSLAGSIHVLPQLVSFPVTGVGTVSSPVSVTVTNGSAAIPLANLSFTASSGFQWTAGTCGSSLAPGASCTLAVEFAPTTTGAQSGDLVIASSELAANATVALSGLGYDFTATLSSPTSRTVAGGQTATFTLSLAPVGGSDGSFTFQCGSLPSNASCSFNPANPTVAAGATGTELVRIATGVTSNATARRSAKPTRQTMLWAGLLLLLPACYRRSRKGLGLVVLWACVSAVSSCASSGGGSASSTTGNTTQLPGNPAGTYTIPVTVTSNGVQHTLSLTLVVD